MFLFFRKKRKRKRPKKRAQSFLVLLPTGMVVLLCVSFGVYHFVFAETKELKPIIVEMDPNIGIREKIVEFFENNEAPEMVDIIRCESQFRHYEPDGSVLKNTEGSSAIGVAQIMQSKHPDPKVLRSYNRRYDMDLTIDDFDITTLHGNMGYALVLYQVRGTRDWECAQRFRF